MINDGKKRTFKQWQNLKEKQELVEEKKGPEVRYGVCKCGNGSFAHKIENRQMIRICKNEACKDEKIV